MSRNVCSKRSGRATAGSYSTSACSCVRLTATLSTPGMRPRAFSMVPVHSEQCRPPILARIFFRSGRLVGSSVQAMALLMVRRYTPRALRRTAHRFRTSAQELMDVRARRPAALANRYDLFDFSERNSEAACLLHEVQHPDGLGIVEAVPIRGTLSRRQNALALIEANRLRRDPGP